MKQGDIANDRQHARTGLRPRLFKPHHDAEAKDPAIAGAAGDHILKLIGTPGSATAAANVERIR